MHADACVMIGELEVNKGSLKSALCHLKSVVDVKVKFKAQ
jgi:hypothetical protein